MAPDTAAGGNAQSQPPVGDMIHPVVLVKFALDVRRIRQLLTEGDVEQVGQKLDRLACDMEDRSQMSVDPQRCNHPRWSFREGREVCRTCGADVSHIDPMGG